MLTVLSKELTGTAATADLLSAAHRVGEGVLVSTSQVPRQEEDSAGAPAGFLFLLHTHSGTLVYNGAHFPPEGSIVTQN